MPPRASREAPAAGEPAGRHPTAGAEPGGPAAPAPLAGTAPAATLPAGDEPGGEDTSAAAGPPPARVVIDEGVKLSQSSLFHLQRQFFDASGVEAWTSKGVPTYITTNPFIARCYARIACAFLDDVLGWRGGSPGDAASRGDAGPGLRVVELGAGTGRFAYHFVKAASALLERAGHPPGTLSYVLTDFTETNIEHWCKQPKLAALIESGTLDVARFDAADPALLELRASGERVGPRGVRGGGAAPLVVIANYVLDSIPNDLFALQGGELYEERVTMTAPEGWASMADVELMSALELSFDRQLLEGGAAAAYPDDEELRELLDFYAGQLSSTSFLVPAAAIRCLRFFHSIADPLLVLVGDRGYHRLEDLLVNPGMQMGVHGGAFSLPVNGHALSWFAARHGGRALHPAGGHSSLDVSAFLFGLDNSASRRTDDAYVVNVEEQGPDDWFYLRDVALRSLESLSLADLLALLRCSAYDPAVFRLVLPRLIACAESAADDAGPGLYRMLELVFDNHFEEPGGYDLAFDIASLLYGMDSFEEALTYLDRSEAEFGEHPSTSYNRGMCYWHLHRLPEALRSVERTLELDPSFDRARGMRVTIAGAMERLPSQGRPRH